MSEERKYEVLPGVELPDMKAINAAASDFTSSGVSDIQIKTPKPVFTSEGTPDDTATAAELEALQSLGDQVAADEARAAAESRRRMDSILASAVKQPESIVDLLNYNKDKVSEEVIKQKQEELKKAEELKAAAEKKEREREERRQLQQRLLEEARERAAAMREAEKRGIKADETLLDKAEENAEPEKEPADEPVNEPVKEPVIEPAEEPEKSFANPDKVFEEPVAEAKSVFKAIAENENESEKVVEAPAAEPVKEPETKPEPPVARKPLLEPEEPVKPSIASVEETFDDFSEFLDGNK